MLTVPSALIVTGPFGTEVTLTAEASKATPFKVSLANTLPAFADPSNPFTGPTESEFAHNTLNNVTLDPVATQVESVVERTDKV